MRAGRVRDDPRQRNALEALDRVWNEMREPAPSIVSGPFGGLGWLFGRRKEVAPSEGRLNVYLHGSVGTGKSLLMDLLFEQVEDPLKARVHFHDFMLDVHRKIHQWRKFERKSSDDDPIAPVAWKLRKSARLLCFDEFQVTDVADAMILKRLFEEMMGHGMRFVTTSNRAPNELYKGGLNRPLFEPFISNVLEKQFEIVDLTSSKDYRLVGEKSPKSVYLYPLSSEEAVRRFQETFKQLTHGMQSKATDLEAFGSRKVHVPISVRGVCLFSWNELIASSLGASDYLAIARHFHTVMLRGVPRMSVADNTQARRFITFIDALYERRCKLILLADAPCEQLFPTEEEAQGAAQEEVFAFRRTVSRLVEMSSSAYLEQPHRGEHIGASH